MCSRLSSLLALTLTAGCASLPVVAPGPVHPLPVGLNDGWHGTLPAIVFAQDCPTMIRTPQVSGAALQAFMDAAPANCPVLALVEQPDVDLVRQFGMVNPPAIELANEAELPPFELTPSQYGDWIARAVNALQGIDYRGTIVMGGVYALTPETRTAIRWGILNCSALGRTCVIGVHLYDASDEDLAWLRSLNWPVWITEFGMPDNCDPAKIAAKPEFLAAQIVRFSTVPKIERVFIYQGPRGATCNNLDTFGISGQPAMELLR